MNPGVIANLSAWVAVILLLTQWGKSICEEMGISAKKAVFVLIGLVIAASFDLECLNLSFNLGGILFPLLLIGLTLSKLRQMTSILNFLSCLLGVASPVFVLMKVFPYDPAMFLVDDHILYPLVASLLSILFMRSQLTAISAGTIGIFGASVLDSVFHFHVPLMQVFWGDGEVRDLMALTAFACSILHGCLRMIVQFVRSRTLNSKGSYERGTS